VKPGLPRGGAPARTVRHRCLRSIACGRIVWGRSLGDPLGRHGGAACLLPSAPPNASPRAVLPAGALQNATATSRDSRHRASVWSAVPATLAPLFHSGAGGDAHSPQHPLATRAPKPVRRPTEKHVSCSGLFPFEGMRRRLQSAAVLRPTQRLNGGVI
jgi:hypothetical protein